MHLCISSGGSHGVLARSVRYDITSIPYEYLGVFLRRVIEYRYTVCRRSWIDDRPYDARHSYHGRAVSRRIHDPWSTVPPRPRARILSPYQHCWPSRAHADPSDADGDPSSAAPSARTHPDHDTGRLGYRHTRD